MQWTVVTLVLCSVVALGWTCCVPDQWEGDQYTVAGYASLFHHGLLREYNYAAYDATNKRSALFMTYINGDIEARLQFLIVYNGTEGNLYVENLKKQKCWTKELKEDFRKACIPDDAHDYGSYFLGLKGSYNVSSYRVECKKGTTILTVQPVSEGVCAPISELSVSRKYHYDVLTTVGFSNLSPGIKNETVFDVPKDCSSDWDDFDLPIDPERNQYYLAL